jgi:hypothetical protein
VGQDRAELITGGRVVVETARVASRELGAIP